MQAAFSVEQCHKCVGRSEPFLLVVPRGCDLKQSILRAAELAKLNAAVLNGIGAIADPTVGYFDFAARAYQERTFTGLYEIVNFTANLTTLAGEWILHAHIGFSDAACQLLGGHFIAADVAVTAEIKIHPLSAPIQRKFDEDIQLNLIDPSL